MPPGQMDLEWAPGFLNLEKPPLGPVQHQSRQMAAIARPGINSYPVRADLRFARGRMAVDDDLAVVKDIDSPTHRNLAE